MAFPRMMKVRHDPACPLCGDSPNIHELIDYDQFCGTPPLIASETSSGDTVSVLTEGTRS